MSQTIKAPEWDISKTRLNADGVVSYAWPLPYGSIMEFNNKAILAYAEIMQKSDRAETPLALLPYQALGKYYICEISGLYRALLLQKKSQEAGIAPTIPQRWLYCPWVWRGQAPKEIAFLKSFQKKGQTSTSQRWMKFHPKRLLNLIKKFKPSTKGLMIDGLRVRSINADRLKNNIIATQRTELIQKHAKKIKEDVIFCRSDRWFQSVSDQEIQSAILEKNKDIEDQILKIFQNFCDQENIKIPETIATYLKEFVERNAACLRVHIDRLTNDKVDIPYRLWTGTAGNIWDLLLRAEVMRRGGRVSGYDHGTVSGLTQTYFVPFLELWACNSFYTYTTAHAHSLKKLASGGQTLSNKIPDILGLLDTKINIHKKDTIKSNEIKKIMIVSTIYDRDRGRMSEMAAEISKIDFQARLIHYLSEQGYQVIFKPHPESPSLPPKDFATLGAEIEMGRFTDVAERADLFIFDYAYTSTFKEALETSTPFIMIDTEETPWEETMLPLLEERVSLVRGSQDNENRFHIDWRQLDKAIEEAPLKAQNHAFYQTYFGYSEKL